MKSRSKKLIVICIALGFLGFIILAISPFVPLRVNITMATNGLPCLFGIPMRAGVSRDFVYWTLIHSGLQVHVSLDGKVGKDSVTFSNLVETFRDLDRSGLSKTGHEE
jgi:hypothetical protein